MLLGLWRGRVTGDKAEKSHAHAAPRSLALARTLHSYSTHSHPRSEADEGPQYTPHDGQAIARQRGRRAAYDALLVVRSGRRRCPRRRPLAEPLAAVSKLGAAGLIRRRVAAVEAKRALVPRKEALRLRIATSILVFNLALREAHSGKSRLGRRDKRARDASALRLDGDDEQSPMTAARRAPRRLASG